MKTWIVEQGVSARIARSASRMPSQSAARIDWPGALACGQVEDAVLISRASGSPRGTARFASGELALVDRLPGDANEGAAIRLEVRRPKLSERGRTKLAQARPTDAAPRPAPRLAEALASEGGQVTVVRRFPAGDWEHVWARPGTGTVNFAGGSLHFSPTPAMTLVDIDGTPGARDLALASIAPLALALRLFDLGGSIGALIFPCFETKADRRVLDEALETALAGWPHEKTAMNGFGFVQMVARLERPSLLHRIGQNCVGVVAMYAASTRRER